jgi:hypothetical protein
LISPACYKKRPQTNFGQRMTTVKANHLTNLRIHSVTRVHDGVFYYGIRDNQQVVMAQRPECEATVFLDLRTHFPNAEHDIDTIYFTDDYLVVLTVTYVTLVFSKTTPRQLIHTETADSSMVGDKLVDLPYMFTSIDDWKVKSYRGIFEHELTTSNLKPIYSRCSIVYPEYDKRYFLPRLMQYAVYPKDYDDAEEKIEITYEFGVEAISPTKYITWTFDMDAFCIKLNVHDQVSGKTHKFSVPDDSETFCHGFNPLFSNNQLYLISSRSRYSCYDLYKVDIDFDKLT